MITGLVGTKIDQVQKFLEDGTRIPVTIVSIPGLPVVMVKTKDKNGYFAIQVAVGVKKKGNKASLGHVKGANLDKAPRFLREIRLDNKSKDEIKQDLLPKVGDVIKAADVLSPGDIVDVTGVSKGKGYAGVVKRHGFKGGPRTHGQSDRERAPGSIGQTTTPGRVYKGKRMAGRMGQDTVTLRNLEVVDVLDLEVLIKGLVPGVKNSIISITRVGKGKKFVPLLKAKVAETASSPETSPALTAVGQGGRSDEVHKEQSKEEENAKS